MGGSAGYSCTEELVTLTDESVVTAQQGNHSEGTLSYSDPITADTIKVTFNGVEYTCQRTANDGDYGAPYNSETQSFDWSEYPFNLYNDTVSTENAGTYQIKIATVEEIIETSECFDKAVRRTEIVTFTFDEETNYGNIISVASITADKTYTEVESAYNSGSFIIAKVVLLNSQMVYYIPLSSYYDEYRAFEFHDVLGGLPLEVQGNANLVNIGYEPDNVIDANGATLLYVIATRALTLSDGGDWSWRSDNN